MNALTSADIDLIMESLELWESDESRSTMFSAMFGIITSPSKEAAQQLIEEATRKSSSKDFGRMRRERSTLLKAKLIQMKQDEAVERIAGGA